MLKIRFQSKSTKIILIITILLFISYYLGLGRFTNKYIIFIINPLIKNANYISRSLTDFIYPYFSLSDLRKQNDEFRNKFIELAKQNIELTLLREENNFLKKELKFLDDYNYDYIIANVLGRSLNYPSNSILIDKGSSSGLKPNLAVTTNQGVIIGKLNKVKENISYVRLLIDNSSKLAVLVAGQKAALGLAQGQHNINLKIVMLPKDISVAVDELVTTSGLEADIPSGLLVGYVTKVNKSQEKFWQEALVEPVIDYKSVRMVTIILPAGN